MYQCSASWLVHTDENFESVSVNVARKKIIVSCFYCQPSLNKNNYLNRIEEMLERSGDLPLLVASDFNIELLLDELVLRKKIENMMAAHYLNVISLREATRETENFSSCIDAIFGNVPLLNYTIEKATISDHYSWHSKLDLESEAIECIYSFRCLKKLGNRDYSEKVSFYLAQALRKTEETGQSGEAYITKIVEVMKIVTDQYFPCQGLKNFYSRETWKTNRVKRHVKNCDKLLQLWVKSKPERAHLNYRNKRNKLNMEIKLAQRRDVQSKSDHKSPREIFNYIRKMKGVVSDTKIKGDLMANAFNDYFLNASEFLRFWIIALCQTIINRNSHCTFRISLMKRFEQYSKN